MFNVNRKGGGQSCCEAPEHVLLCTNVEGLVEGKMSKGETESLRALRDGRFLVTSFLETFPSDRAIDREKFKNAPKCHCCTERFVREQFQEMGLSSEWNTSASHP
jgi:hypothetical protein